MSSQTSTATALPLKAGTWVVDDLHSSVTFTIRHLGLAKVRGRFSTFGATVEISDTGAANVRATIDLGSINTNNADRDNHLRSTDFFDTAKHPEMTFVSNAFTGSGDDWTLSGDVTLNGITRPLTLKVEFNGTEEFSPTGRTHAGFEATGSIKRSEFGIEFGILPIGGDRLALGDEVKFELDLELYQP